MELPITVAATEVDIDRAIDALKIAVSAGLLTVTEFEDRLNAVYASASRTELDAIVGSLPRSNPHPPRWEARAAAGIACLIAVAAVSIVVVGWLARSPRSIQGAPTQTIAGAAPLSPEVSQAVLAAECGRTVPLSQMQTAWLNKPAAFALPSADIANKCVATAGLSASRTQSSDHIYIHLDLSLESGPIVIPAGLGVEPVTKAKTQIYTDNSQGVVTVAAGGTYTLSQLFREWGHPLTSQAIGNLRLLPDFPVLWFVNGKPVANANAIVLRSGEEIEGFEDLRGSTINPTKRYAFPPGYRPKKPSSPASQV
jgi:hypothetical protein